MQSNDLPGKAQADPGALTFGGKERDEDFFGNLCRNAFAVINNLYHWIAPAVCCAFQFNFRMPDTVDRLYGIFAKID